MKLKEDKYVPDARMLAIYENLEHQRHMLIWLDEQCMWDLF